MKLFLASSLNKTMQKFDEKIEGGLSGKSILFIANASDPYDGEKWWIENDRMAFEVSGCTITDVDIRVVGADTFRSMLCDADIIHVCGGSVLYLMSLIREKGLEDILKNSVVGGHIVYSGTSAGSMIPAKNLELSKYEEEETLFIERMTDWSGLGFVNFSVLPHADSVDFFETNKEIVGHIAEHQQPVVILSDTQAVWCVDEKFEIIEV
jgi:dipeptidase E